MMVIGWFNKLGILLEYSIKIATSLSYVALQTTGKTDVRVSINKHFHVHYLNTKQSTYSSDVNYKHVALKEFLVKTIADALSIRQHQRLTISADSVIQHIQHNG